MNSTSTVPIEDRKCSWFVAACYYGRLDYMVKILKQDGFKIKQRDIISSMFTACNNANFKIVKFLVESDIDVNLQMDVYYKRDQFEKNEKYFNINTIVGPSSDKEGVDEGDDYDSYLLINSCIRFSDTKKPTRLKIIKYLLDNGTDIKKRYQISRKMFGKDELLDMETTVCHEAAYYLQVEIMELLIFHGADLNSKGLDNYIPLNIAILRIVLHLVHS